MALKKKHLRHDDVIIQLQSGVYLHRFCGYNVILEIFEEEVLADIVLWAVQVAHSEYGKVLRDDVANL